MGGLKEGSIKGRRKGEGRRPSRSTDSPFRPRELGRGDILAHRVCRPGFGASASEKTAGPPAKRIEFCELYKSIHSSLLRRIDGTLEFLLPKRILLFFSSFSSSFSCETRIRSNQRLLSIDILSKYLIFNICRHEDGQFLPLETFFLVGFFFFLRRFIWIRDLLNLMMEFRDRFSSIVERERERIGPDFSLFLIKIEQAFRKFRTTIAIE